MHRLMNIQTKCYFFVTQVSEWIEDAIKIFYELFIYRFVWLFITYFLHPFVAEHCNNYHFKFLRSAIIKGKFVFVLLLLTCFFSANELGFYGFWNVVLKVIACKRCSITVHFRSVFIIFLYFRYFIFIQKILYFIIKVFF